MYWNRFLFDVIKKNQNQSSWVSGFYSEDNYAANLSYANVF